MFEAPRRSEKICSISHHLIQYITLRSLLFSLSRLGNIFFFLIISFLNKRIQKRKLKFSPLYKAPFQCSSIYVLVLILLLFANFFLFVFFSRNKYNTQLSIFTFYTHLLLSSFRRRRRRFLYIYIFKFSHLFYIYFKSGSYFRRRLCFISIGVFIIFHSDLFLIRFV